MMSGCSTNYRYWSLDLAAGTSLTDIRDQFNAAAERLAPDLERLQQDIAVGYFYIPEARPISTKRSTRRPDPRSPP